MGYDCEIHTLVSDDGDVCPVCSTPAAPDAESDAWEELRALATAPEPEPLVLEVG